jgi:hypothetical protein
MQQPSITELIQFYRAHQIVDQGLATEALRRLLKRWSDHMIDAICEDLGLSLGDCAEKQARVEAITAAIRLRCSQLEERKTPPHA